MSKWWEVYTDPDTGKDMVRIGSEVMEYDKYNSMSEKEKLDLVERTTPKEIKKSMSIGAKIGKYLAVITGLILTAFGGTVLYEILIKNGLSAFMATILASSAVLIITVILGKAANFLGEQLMNKLLSK